VLTIDLAFIQLRIFPFAASLDQAILVSVAFGASATLTGFVLHELAHKVAAQHRGYEAEFQMSPMGLLFSFITALIGFLFAMPGATVVQGMHGREDWGWTGLAGPLTNLSFGAVFLAGAAGLYFQGLYPIAYYYVLLLAFFNGWFAAFNLIPVSVLDGRKVLHWNAGYWGLSFAASLGLTIGAVLLFYGFVSF
jgi:Zn-dependent protease